MKICKESSFTFHKLEHKYLGSHSDTEFEEAKTFLKSFNFLSSYYETLFIFENSSHSWKNNVSNKSTA